MQFFILYFSFVFFSLSPCACAWFSCLLLWSEQRGRRAGSGEVFLWWAACKQILQRVTLLAEHSVFLVARVVSGSHLQSPVYCICVELAAVASTIICQHDGRTEIKICWFFLFFFFACASPNHYVRMLWKYPLRPYNPTSQYYWWCQCKSSKASCYGSALFHFWHDFPFSTPTFWGKTSKPTAQSETLCLNFWYQYIAWCWVD